MEYLKSQIWGEEAEYLLSECRRLPAKSKNILMIRHSAREEPTSFKDTISAQLTEIGRKSALEFGKNLSSQFSYTIYHSPLKRCQETAQLINKGLQEQGIKSIMAGSMNSLIRIDGGKEKIPYYWDRDGAEPFINYWFGGFYPLWEIEPAIQVAQRTAMEIKQHLMNIEDSTIIICVSHDYSILSYLFYWAGILSSHSWIKYLGGFIMQINENFLKIYHNHQQKDVPFPYWWNL